MSRRHRRRSSAAVVARLKSNRSERSEASKYEDDGVKKRRPVLSSRRQSRQSTQSRRRKDEQSYHQPRRRRRRASSSSASSSSSSDASDSSEVDSSDNDNDNGNDDHSGNDNDNHSNTPSTGSHQHRRHHRSTNSATRQRRSSIAKAAQSSSKRHARTLDTVPDRSEDSDDSDDSDDDSNDGSEAEQEYISNKRGSGSRRAGVSARGHLMPAQYRPAEEQKESSLEPSTTTATTRPSSWSASRTSERARELRIEATLGRVRSKIGRDPTASLSSGSSSSFSAGSRSTASMERTRGHHYSRSLGSSNNHWGDGNAFKQPHEEDWFLERQRSRQEETKRERMQGARREARKSIVRYDYHDLLQVDDSEHLDTADLNRLVSLLRYNRGYPVQSNFTRFEFPQNVFLSNKYSSKGCQLICSILKASLKKIKRLGFDQFFLEQPEDVALILNTIDANQVIQLSHFILSNNDLSHPECVQHVCTWLQPNMAVLEQLHLRNCELDDESVLLITETIIECHNNSDEKIALELLDISGSRQKYTPSLVREMIRDMEDAGCTVDVVYEKKKKKKKKHRKR